MRWHSAWPAPAANPSEASTLPSSPASMKPSPLRSKTRNAAAASPTRPMAMTLSEMVSTACAREKWNE
uniref:Uncharacterized protein n=1 Tax=Oryza glumipatula TaxID=40148 RepID=A0A0E0B2V6_9ORYZ